MRRAIRALRKSDQREFVVRPPVPEPKGVQRASGRQARAVPSKGSVEVGGHNSSENRKIGRPPFLLGGGEELDLKEERAGLLEEVQRRREVERRASELSGLDALDHLSGDRLEQFGYVNTPCRRR
jgi:hypothetical protein